MVGNLHEGIACWDCICQLQVKQLERTVWSKGGEQVITGTEHDRPSLSATFGTHPLLGSACQTNFNAGRRREFNSF